MLLFTYFNIKHVLGSDNKFCSAIVKFNYLEHKMDIKDFSSSHDQTIWNIALEEHNEIFYLYSFQL